MAKKWYKIQAKEDSADVYIYDYIGAYGVEAAALTRDLALIKDKKNINLYINSPGGDVFEGMTIYNSLLQIKEKLTVHVMGLAASIASVIMLAAEKRIMYQGSMVMIHNPWGCACGNAKEMREMAEVLDKIGG
jgi:ATP-dependent Clp endopeptidase proteolytic subunit ClpP